MRHWRALAALGGLMLASCTMWREHPVRGWKDATGGLGLEQNFWNQLKNKQWKDLEQHIASNYVWVATHEGRLDRAAAVERLRKLDLKEFSLGELQTELNGETFVVTYSITMRGSSVEGPLPSEPVRMMSVWQKQNAGWMAIAHTVLGPGT